MDISSISEVLYPEPTKALVSNVVDGDTVDVVIDGRKLEWGFYEWILPKPFILES